MENWLNLGRTAQETHTQIKNLISPGINTFQIEELIKNIYDQNNVFPAFTRVKNYPFCSCISVNNEIVHGFPSKSKILREGDIVSVDIGLEKDGAIIDCCKTYPVGKISDKLAKFLEDTEYILNKIASKIKAGILVEEISQEIYLFAKLNGYYVPPGFCGHTIGKTLHEAPLIPNYWDSTADLSQEIKENTVIAVEPIYFLLEDEFYEDPRDKWTWKTKNINNFAVHFEHSIYVQNESSIVLNNIGE